MNIDLNTTIKSKLIAKLACKMHRKLEHTHSISEIYFNTISSKLFSVLYGKMRRVRNGLL